MTATERYWTCVDGNLLPATVPLVVGQDRGIATAGFGFRNAVASQIALSDSAKERAIAAIVACHALHHELGMLSGTQTSGA